MVAIRLRRAGSKKRPFFRVVVTDSRAARDSSFVEILGHYNPRSRPAVVQVNKERLEQWVKKGAQMSNSVRTLVARHLTAPPVAATSVAAEPAAAPAPKPATVTANADTVVMARPTEAASAGESAEESAPKQS